MSVWLLELVLLAGCGGAPSGPGGEITCREYEAMRADNWMFGAPPTREQEAVIEKMLHDNDHSISQGVIRFVHTGVTAWCSGVSNKDKPIENSFDWDTRPLVIPIEL